MNVEQHHWHSDALRHEMWLKVYGHAGRPVVAFPSQDGRYGDWEGWGMVDAVAGLIDVGRMRLIAVDSIDWQSWTNQSSPPGDRALRHEAYDRYIADELAPFVHTLTGADRAWTTGASMGAYHAVNTLFRYPAKFIAGWIDQLAPSPRSTRIATGGGRGGKTLGAFALT